MSATPAAAKPRARKRPALPRSPRPGPEFHYRRTSTGVRVWNPEWAGDEFEVFHEEDFARVQSLLASLSIALVEHYDDD